MSPDAAPSEGGSRRSVLPRRTGRSRDRSVYLGSHPFLFALLGLTRRMPVLRLGGVVLVNGTHAYTEALTHFPLDRLAAGTTGGSAQRLDVGAQHLFDQSAEEHRRARRSLAEDLGAAGVDRLRSVWLEVLGRRLAPLAGGGTVDLVPLAHEVAGATTAALLGIDTDPLVLSRAAREAASASGREHLVPGGRFLRGSRADAQAAVRRLNEVLRAQDQARPAAVLAVAAVNTTVAALPRAAAWCADDGLWDRAGDPSSREILVSELLRVTAPSPVLPRAAARGGRLGGKPVRAGGRLLLVARHAARAHSRDPDVTDPAPAHVAQLVFGVGAHACPGANLARRQLSDLLASLSPHRPEVVRSVVDRGSLLPAWRHLVVRSSSRG